MKRHMICGFFLGVLTIGAASATPLSALTVRSVDIVPADGTSGQVLTTGNGVKTGHIQNLAVTGAKIATGTITAGNIGNSQITNLLLAPSAVTTDKIQDGTIATADLASGAVTDGKISGVISAVKLPVGTASGTVAAGDHRHDSLYQERYANVVVVAKSGGDFTDPIAAVNSITNASSENPYLVKIMPGTYDLSNQTLGMKGYVDIEGSGENVTIIRGTSTGYGGNTVSAVSNAELRSVTVSCTTSYGDEVYAIWCSGSPKLSHVTAIATGGGWTVGILNNADASTIINDVSVISSGPVYSIGIQNYSASPVLNDVTITATDATYSYGVYSRASNMIMTNLRASASGLTQSFGLASFYGGVTTIDRSTLDGVSGAVVNSDASTVVRIGASKLVGGVTSYGPTTCVGSYNGNYGALDASCQ